MLDYAGTGGGFAPWWGNETVAHLRSFTQNSESYNSSKVKGMLTLSESFNVVKQTPKNCTGLCENYIPAKSNITQTVPQKSNNMQKIKNETLAVTNSNKKNDTVNVISESSSSKSKLSTKTTSQSKNTSRPKHTQKAAVKKNLFAKLQLVKDGKVVNTNNTDALVNVRPKNSREHEPNTNAKPKDTHAVTPKDTPKHAPRRPPPKEKYSLARAAPRPSQRGALSLARQKSVVANKTSAKGVKAHGKSLAVLQRGVSHDVDSKEVSLSKEEIARIRKRLEEENERQKVYNVHLYGPVLSNTSILLVQVSQYWNEGDFQVLW